MMVVAKLHQITMAGRRAITRWFDDKNDDESLPDEETTLKTTKIQEHHLVETEEDSTAICLSRRSSVLVDLLSLFRRSSSIGKIFRVGATLSNDEDSDGLDSPNTSREKVLNAIKQKKEVIIKLKSQPWSMSRKRRTLKVARRYLQRQKSKVSRWHLWKVEILRQLTIIGRWCDNMKIYLIPWEAKIKKIENHFGSVVSSYFTFLRWILSINVTMTIIMMLFVTIPEWLANSRADPVQYNNTYNIKVMNERELQRADELNTVLDFKGYLEYSLLFYGFYSSGTFFGETIQYSVPVAYFVVNLFILGYSFFVILRKMAANARQSKLVEGKTQQYVFNWKTFTGWDYTVGNPETATNVVMSNVIKFREAIAEYKVNKKKKFDCLQLTLRIIANILVFMMLAGSVWAISAVSQIKTKTTFFQRNAVSITVSFITLTFPNFFDLISKLERYHPRTTLRLQLGRVLFLYIVNYYTLIVALMFMLDTMESQRNMGYQLALADQYSDIVQNTTVPPPNRVLRHANDLTIEYLKNFSTSTPPPKLQSWTTVFSHFGPLGLINPKVVVSENAKNIVNSSSFLAHPIGIIDWMKSNNSKPILLNYTTNKNVITALKLADWYEECWENLIGQEITKLVTMDLIMTIVSILVIDFFRGLWVRYCNLWWFWNLECTFPEYGEFKVAENVLHLVNNQGMIWLGLFFVPMLSAINNIKLIILMYVRAWAVMTCNVPARQIFRASRSSNFYLILLLLMLFLCTLPVGYVIASKKPSKICGPFGSQERFYSVIIQLMDRHLSKGLVKAIKYLSSPGIIIPVLLLLLLIIYFLFALVRGLREANVDLSKQLIHERTEEKKKIFELAGGKKRSLANSKKNYCRNTHGVKSSGSSTDEDKSSRHSNLHSFVPSLKSVNETDLCESQQLDQSSSIKLESSWKQRLLYYCKYLDCRKCIKRQQSSMLSVNETSKNISPVSGDKSILQTTSEDQHSNTSLNDASSSFNPSSSQSYHDCLNMDDLENIKIVISKPKGTSSTRNLLEVERNKPEEMTSSKLSKVSNSSQNSFFEENYIPPRISYDRKEQKSVDNLLNDRSDFIQLQPLNSKVHQSISSEREFPLSNSQNISDQEQRKLSVIGQFDPRMIHSDPSGSYANAMRCPLIKQSKTLLDSESEEEFNQGVSEKKKLISPNERSRSNSRSYTQPKRHNYKELDNVEEKLPSKNVSKPPRFKIPSTSAGKYKQSTVSGHDRPSRQFELRMRTQKDANKRLLDESDSSSSPIRQDPTKPLT